MKNAETILRELCEERGYVCEVEGCRRHPHDAHHVFLHQRKRFPELDVEINLQLICRPHHEDGTGNSLANKAYFWNIQEDRGYNVSKWVAGLRMKIKHV